MIEDLHDQGPSLKEVCTVIAAILEIEPAEARIFVAESPVWFEVVDQSSPIIDEVMQFLGRDGNLEDLGDGVVVFHEKRAVDVLLGTPLPIPAV